MSKQPMDLKSQVTLLFLTSFIIKTVHPLFIQDGTIPKAKHCYKCSTNCSWMIVIFLNQRLLTPSGKGTFQCDIDIQEIILQTSSAVIFYFSHYTFQCQ